MAQITRIDPIAKQQKPILRVAAYCRVSTNSADQQNSYARQLDAYKSMIEKRPDWTLVDIFADEGISGTSSEKRTDFLRMIKMCELRQIDLIITKSVSRFARNVKEALEYVRKLKLLGVAVMFEKEGINTQSMADEMLLNTFAAIAQEESVSISKNIRFSVRKKMAKGDYMNSTVPFGFIWEEKKPVPYAPEAKVVRQIFDWYLGGYSTTRIARELNERGVPTKTGTNIWRPSRIAAVIRNEKYMGDTMCQKKYTTEFPFKQKVNRGEENRYYSTDTHEAIVSREVFEAANALMDKRAEASAPKGETKKYAFTGKLFCAECGSVMSRKVQGGRERWICRTHLEDSSKCNAHYVQTDRIEDGFISIVNNLRFGGNVLSSVEGQLIQTIQQLKMNDSESIATNKETAELNGQILMLEQLRAKGYLASDVYQSRYRELSSKLSGLKAKKLSSTAMVLEETLKNIRKLKNRIEEIDDPLSVFDPGLFNDVVVSGTVSEQDELTIEFIGGLKFKELI